MPGLAASRPKAILAIEDQRFYDHRGVDTDPDRRRRRSRTCAKAAGAGRQHASRSSSRGRVSSRATRRCRRKLQEVSSRRELESTYTKDEILELYLNKVYFGDGLLRRRGRGARLLRQARLRR